MKTYSYSAIINFLNCPRKYQLHFIDKLEPNIINFNFIVGSGVDIGVKHLYMHNDPDEAIKIALELLKDKHKKIQKIIFIQEKDEILFNRAEVIVESALEAYYNYYKKEMMKFEVLAENEKIKAELIKGTLIFGHPDLILKRLVNNKIYIYEIKSANNITKEMIDRYFYDMQVSIYFLIASVKYNLAGIYFDCIKKPTIKLGKSETEASFLSRLRDFYLLGDTEEIFYRDSYKINQEQLKETIKTIEYVVYNMSKATNYPMNRSRCYDFNSTCEFNHLCNYGKNDVTLKNYHTKVYS